MSKQLAWFGSLTVLLIASSAWGSTSPTIWQHHSVKTPTSPQTLFRVQARTWNFVCRSHRSARIGRSDGNVCVVSYPKRDIVYRDFLVLSRPYATMGWAPYLRRQMPQTAVDVRTRGRRPQYLCRVIAANGRHDVGMFQKRSCLIHREGLTERAPIFDILVDSDLILRVKVAEARQLFARTGQAIQAQRTRVLPSIPNIPQAWTLQRALQQAATGFRQRLDQILSKLPQSHQGRVTSYRFGIVQRAQGVNRMVEVRADDLLANFQKEVSFFKTRIIWAQGRKDVLDLHNLVTQTIRSYTAEDRPKPHPVNRQRIANLKVLKARVVATAKRVRTMNRNLDRLVTERLDPLPQEISDRIFFLKPYLPSADRLRILKRFMWKLPKDRISNVLKGLGRLRELYHATDPSADYLLAVEAWFHSMEDVAGALEQRKMPRLPPMGSTAFSSPQVRRLVANLKRNGFNWVYEQADPDEMGGGVVSSLHISPNLPWAIARLAPIAPADVVARLRCLHFKRRSPRDLGRQIRLCDSLFKQHPKSQLRARTEGDVARLIVTHAETMRQSHCFALARSVAKTGYGSTVRNACLAKKARQKRLIARRKAASEVARAARSGNIRRAEKLLASFIRSYPAAPSLYRLQHAIARAKAAQQTRDAARREVRFSEIAKQAPRLEATCRRSERIYRRTRKRMRFAIRQGQEGRAAELRSLHDAVFYQACQARSSLQGLARYYQKTKRSHLARKIIERSPTCMVKWRICER